MAEKVDTDLAALFSGFSSTVDKSQAAVTVQDIFKAAAILRNNKANQNGAFVCVLHPYQAYDLKNQLTNAGSTMSHSLSDVGNTALLNGFIGRIAGIDVFESTVVTSITGPPSGVSGESVVIESELILHPLYLRFSKDNPW